jgi:hypothetical protein
MQIRCPQFFLLGILMAATPVNTPYPLLLAHLWFLLILTISVVEADRL